MASSNIKQSSIADKSIILTISSLGTKIISLAATMIVTRMLDETDYATYKQVFLAFNVVLPFLAFGLVHGLFYFLPFEKERVRGRVYDCYAILLASGLLFSLFILLGGNELLAQRFNNPEVAPLIKLIIPYVIITVVNQCSTAIFNIMNRVRTYMVFTIISGLVGNIVLIAAILLAPTAKSAVLAMVATRSIEGIIKLYLISKILPKDSSRPSIRAIKEILKFSIPMGVAGMVSTFSTQLDSLFVASMSSPEQYAVYTVGAHELIVIGAISSSVTSAVTPQLRLSVANGKLKECGELYQFSARRMASVLVPMMCFFWVWADEFITFIYSEKYIGAVGIFRAYLVYFLLRIVVTGQVFSSLGMGKYILTRSILTCILNAVLNYFGIKLMGPIGAAIATVLSGGLMFIFSTAPMLHKKLGMRLIDTFPVATAGKSIILGMGVGYLLNILLDGKAVPWLIGLIPLESWFGAEMVPTLSSGIQLVVYCLLFIAVFAPIALLLMRDDYQWIIIKIKDMLSKAFSKFTRRKLKAE